MIAPSSPAFPVPAAATNTGMTIRLNIATQILAGLVSDPAVNGDDKKKWAREALAYADALLHEASK